ncbi:MAG: hypothetical protein OXE78_11080 [Gammaproteobacteria bacterium]|nr:hypothetical protein [Gammaproteobacteria bacterium]
MGSRVDFVKHGKTTFLHIKNVKEYWTPRLRLYRTLFINRWHAAITIGEELNIPSIGERAEHINHASSLSEYLWRYGTFHEDISRTGRIPGTGSGGSEKNSYTSGGLKQIFEQLGPPNMAVAQTAVHYAIWKNGCHKLSYEELEGLVNEELNRHPEYLQSKIKAVGDAIIELHQSMIPFYQEMNYILFRQNEKSEISAKLPITCSIFSPDIKRPQGITSGFDQFPVRGDPILAVHNAFSKNIYNALCWRARYELAKSHALKPWKLGSDFHTGAIIEGKLGIYTTDDEALRSMLKSMSEPGFPLFVQICCSIKRAVSTMITALPMFIVRNFFRDTLAAYVLGRHKQTPFISTVNGAREAVSDLRFGNNEILRDYLLQGGFNSGLAEAEIASGPSDEFIPTSDKYSDLIRKVRRIIYLLTRPAWIAEVGTRLTQFQSALKSGSSKYQAIHDARMVSTDFANIGSSRTWRMYICSVPFFNAAIQGFDQLYQIFRPRYGRKHGESLLTSAQRSHLSKVRNTGLALSLATATVWLWNYTDTGRRLQYEGETEYAKSAYVTAYNVFGQTDFRLPVPFQTGAVFMKLPEIALDLVGSVNSLAGIGFFGHLVHGNLSIGWFPAVIKPIWEIQTNTNFFGEEIVPPYMQYWRPPSRRYYRSTLIPYQFIGKILNVSPLQVEVVVRGYTGHLGSLIMNGIDEVAWLYSGSRGAKPFPRFLSYATGLGVPFNPGAESSSRWLNYYYDSQDNPPSCFGGGICRSFAREENRVQNQADRLISANRDRIENIEKARSSSISNKETLINNLYRGIHAAARRYTVVHQNLLKRYRYNLN